MNVILWLFCGGLFETLGDIIFKYWVMKRGPEFFIGGLVVYVLGLLCLVQSFKSQNIAVATAIFVIFNIISLAFASWIIFGEKLTYQQMGGIVLAIGAVILLR